MKKSAIHPLPLFFDRYILLVDDIDLTEALEKYNRIETYIDKVQLENLDGKIYAPGKWTIKDIIQHVTDNERVQAYRALRIARNDQTPLPGYDENVFANNTNAVNRNLDDLLEEFALVRKTSISLFKNMSEESLQRTALCNNISISALALGFVLVGHLQHHIHIIKERYLPLLH